MPVELERKVSPSGEKVGNLFVKFFPGHVHDTSDRMARFNIPCRTTYNNVVYIFPHILLDSN